MWFNLALIPALLAIAASATPLASSDVSLEARNNDKITYLGSKGATLSGGTKFGNLVFVSGQVPILNGTVVPGGIKNETAFVLARIGDILKEAGTDWSKVLKTTVLLQDVRDLPAMNEVYAATVPNPKPARAAFEVGNLPVFGISVEIEAIAAIY
ncbi:translation initiation inhibitor [Dioszegia hungarica]|uniref:Translation initiation inhibitor n=1 Tax=Dioszegia hungarica TaxID=4972 RepID=A0AA38HEQ3_9TREE|nr:translation initiation inhibitor [Dioszegia hungarica]KAI9638975.1 translation initiation inhibitor [Dioszegia hungarica]